MKYFLALPLLFFALPAFAQGSSITIIHDDGSKDVINLERGAEESVESAPAPETAPQEVVVEEAPAPKAVVEKKVEEKPKEKPKAKPKAALKPKVKPKPKAALEPVEDIVTPPRKPVRQTIPQGAKITPERASYIALEEAPPSSGMKVFLSEFEGAEAYAVVFKVEDGFHEVLVDTVSGQIMSSQPSAYFTATEPRPGHLPQQLR